MRAEDEASQVKMAVRASPSEFDISDVRPLKRRRTGHQSAAPVPQRTVFQPGSDWKAASTNAVLDALHMSSAWQAHDEEAASSALTLSRCAGSVAVHANLADLFDNQLTNPAQGEAGEPPVVQCKSCGRPVLLTRFLTHWESCKKRAVTAKRARPEDADDDLQMRLLCAPYCNDEESEESESAEIAACREGRVDIATRLSKRKTDGTGENEAATKESDDSLHFPREEDSWETTLTTLAPRYVPRCLRKRRRRVPLPSPTETNSHKKRNVNTEKRSSQAAVAAGVMSLQSQGPDAINPSDRDESPVTELAKSFGEGAPWSKLMQMAMPVTMPRDPNAKPIASLQDLSSAQLSLSAKGRNGLQGSGVLKDKNAEASDKPTSNFANPTPSLVGALMWIRASSLKEVANTVLYSIDAPQLPLGRTGTVFHGQTYIGDLGTYETDPRAPTTIKMPLATVGSVHIPGKPGRVPASPSSNSGPQDSRSKKLQGAPTSNPAAAGIAASQQVLKKQRPSKANRAHGPGPTGQLPVGVIPGKAGQVSSRKPGSFTRGPGVFPPVNVKSATNLIESQHRPPAQRNALPPSTTVNAGGSAVVAAPAAAAQYASQQIAQQKKAFRQADAGIGGLPRAAHAVQGALGNAMPPVMKPGGRGGKVRPYPTPNSNNPSPSMRPSNAKVTKTPSPSQGSSRSGDRLPMHRASPLSAGQLDSTLMGPTTSTASSGMNRAAVVRGGTGKAQLLDFQQAMARAVGQGASGSGRDASVASGSRALLHHSPKTQVLGTDQYNAQLQRANMHGLATQPRPKPSPSIPGAQQRLIAQRNSRTPLRGAVRKDGRDLQQKTAELEAQLHRPPAAPGQIVPGTGGKTNPAIIYGNRGGDRNNVTVNHTGSQRSNGVYTGALGGAPTQHSNNAAMKGQANLALFGMAQAPQNAVGGNAGGAPNMLQNIHDMRTLQNVGVVPGMQAGAPNANVLNFLQASGLGGTMAASGGMGISTGMPMTGGLPMSSAVGIGGGAQQTAGMNNAVGAGIAPGAIPPAGNAGVLATEDAILRQLLSASAGRGAALLSNAAGLHGQGVGAGPPQLGHGHGHQGGRTGAMGPAGRPVVQTAATAAIDEIDRALGLSFDESDLQD